MKLGWDDRFKFGMYRAYFVRTVWEHRPSYLVWVLCNTSTRFEDNVMDVIRQRIAQPDPTPGVNPMMVRQFMNKFMEGPW